MAYSWGGVHDFILLFCNLFHVFLLNAFKFNFTFKLFNNITIIKYVTICLYINLLKV